MATTVKKKPTPAQWDQLQAQIIDQFTRQGHTARWIVEDLSRQGYKVTKKMLWDRFSIWQVPRKYNSKQVGENRPPSLLMLVPANAMAVAPEKRCFHITMRSVGNWLEGIMESGSWRLCAVDRRIDMQRLVSRAHLAIATEDYDTKARLLELNSIAHQTRRLMSNLNSHSPMHPRHLTALLRLWIADWQQTKWRQDVHRVVRRMILETSKDVLQPTHPIAVISQLSVTGEPNEIIAGLCHQWHNHFLLPVRACDPDFCAREQVYTARVLASIGRPDKAMDALGGVNLRDDISQSTVADYHSTAGFTLMQERRYREAIHPIESSIEAYETLNESFSESAQYAHFCLYSCYEGLNDLPKQEHQLEEALRIWEFNAKMQRDQGGLNIVRGLHRVYEQRGKSEEMLELRQRYGQFFEEAPASSD